MDIPATYAAAAISGGIVGFLLTLFGGGGSVLATPLLIYAVGVRDPHVAIGTSAAAVSVNAMVGLVAQARAGRVKWPCASLFALMGLLGALGGAHLAKQVEGQKLLLGFAIAMALVALSMFRSPNTAGNPEVRLDERLALRLAPAGAATGLAAGFFGIGGGFLIVPGLMAATGMTLANAAASSLVSVALFGAATSVSYAMSGLVNWPVFTALVLGGVAGSAGAAAFAPRLANRTVLARRLFAAMVMATAAYVAVRAAMGK